MEKPKKKQLLSTTTKAPKKQSKPKVEKQPDVAAAPSPEEEIAALSKQNLKSDLDKLTEDIKRLAPAHSKLARQAGHSGLASDFRALEQIAKQIESKVASRPYWEKA